MLQMYLSTYQLKDGELTASLNVFDLYKNNVYEKIMGITRDADGVARIVGQIQKHLMCQSCL